MTPSPSSSAFALGPNLDASLLAAGFSTNGYIQVGDFLSDGSAALLSAELEERRDWRRVVNGTDQVFEAPAEAFETMDPDERRRLESAVYAAATHGFQFLYDTIRVADDLGSREEDQTFLSAFARFMSAPDTLAFFSRVTGASDLVFADAQATRYRQGDFLTRHDDAVPGKNRSLAYVLGLSCDWQPEWGGLLLLNDQRDGSARALVPRFNALTLFSVGQPHSVSYVAPYAGKDRLSVTGWLRTAPP